MPCPFPKQLKATYIKIIYGTFTITLKWKREKIPNFGKGAAQ